MSRGMAPKLSAQIIREATTWFVEFNEGDVSLSAREEFIAWMRRSPEHVRAYLQVSAHWEDARALEKGRRHSVDDLIALGRSELTNIVPLRDAREVTGGSDRREAGSEPTTGDTQAAPTFATERARRSFPTKLYAVAASVLLAVSSATFTYWWTQLRNVYRTEIGEQRSIQLTDGSMVTLNARSRMRVSFDGSQRDVELLVGQAMFTVAKDVARPFVVRAGDTQVRAVGTRFDVYRKESGTVVTVIEGRVAVEKSSPVIEAVSAPREVTEPGLAGTAAVPTTETILAAGEQAIVRLAQIEKPNKPDIQAATAWTEHQVVLRSTPLVEVVAEFNRYSTRPLVILDPSLNNVKISGVFSSTDSAALLRGLNALGQFHIEETPERVEITRN